MPLIRPDLHTYPSYLRPREETPEPLPGQASGPAPARLHLNEAPEDWPLGPRRALLERLDRLPWNRYPERQPALTERLARRLGAPEEGVLLGPSSGALLDLVALAGLEPGTAVAAPEPGFSLYPALAARHRARLLPVPGGDRDARPWLDCLAREAPRQLWLTLPNNPTGAWLSSAQLEPVLAAAAQLPDPPLVVLDEAYAEFAPGTHRLAVDRYPNVVLLRTFSKALASAGWRLGYLVGAPALVRRLAALQLPYSLPAPALEALEVALDHVGVFAARAREVGERRDRLALALGERAAPSAGNFLLVRPDPGPALRAAGLCSRTLEALGAGRVTVGTEAEAQRTAQALGVPLGPAIPRPARRLLVMDMDGVLVDGEAGFQAAVARALAELAPELPWQLAHHLAFKQLPGFNNDFRLCAAALALARRGGLEPLWTGLPDLEAEIRELEPRCAEAVERAYRSQPNRDQPLVTAEELAAVPWQQAVLTGRNARELELGFQVLGFCRPGVCDTAAHLRKPSPAGLLQLADAFQAEEILFAGDSVDDAQALRSARAARPELVWRFAAVGGNREFLGREGDLRVASLRALLTLLRGERS